MLWSKNPGPVSNQVHKLWLSLLDTAGPQGERGKAAADCQNVGIIGAKNVLGLVEEVAHLALGVSQVTIDRLVPDQASTCSESPTVVSTYRTLTIDQELFKEPNSLINIAGLGQEEGVLLPSCEDVWMVWAEKAFRVSGQPFKRRHCPVFLARLAPEEGQLVASGKRIGMFGAEGLLASGQDLLQLDCGLPGMTGVPQGESKGELRSQDASLSRLSQCRDGIAELPLLLRDQAEAVAVVRFYQGDESLP
jgi:hypothetical protein